MSLSRLWQQQGKRAEARELLALISGWVTEGFDTGDRTVVVTTRPCCAPHHPLSDVGLLGGGPVPMPGDVLLAHHRVHFQAAWPECRRHVLEVLRQPLEETVLSIQSPERPRPQELRRLSSTGAAREGFGPSPGAVHP